MVEPGGLKSGFLGDEDLSGTSKEVGSLLMEMPLASAGDLGAVLKKDPHGVYGYLRELRGRGYIDGLELGWSKAGVMRWWLTDAGLEGALVRYWAAHDRGGRGRLLQVLPGVEWFYQVVSEIEGLGRFEEFVWLDRLGIDAAARFERGWVGLSWSGVLQSEPYIRSRLEGLAVDFRRLAAFGGDAWPALFCFVVSDSWQGVLVNRVLRDMGLLDRVGIWNASDGSRSGVVDLPAGRGWIVQEPRLRDEGPWTWERRVQSSPWAGSNTGGVRLLRGLDLVYEWGGLELGLGRAVFQEGQRGRNFYRLVKDLEGLGLVEKIVQGREVRLGVSRSGLHHLVLRDRVGYDLVDGASVEEIVNGEYRIRSHEALLRGLMGEFARVGCDIACGDRSWEHMGSSGGLSPDGMVFLSDSPYGTGWHYVEMERRAQGVRRVEAKVRGYASDRRQDRWPVLMACADERVEGYFHDVGEQMGGVPMLTCTLARLKEFGAVGNYDCWQMYGQFVPLR